MNSFFNKRNIFIFILIQYIFLGKNICYVNAQSIQGKWVGYYADQENSNSNNLPRTIPYEIYIKEDSAIIYGIAYKNANKSIVSKIFVKGKYDPLHHLIILNEFRILENPMLNTCLLSMHLTYNKNILQGRYIANNTTDLKDIKCAGGYVYLEKDTNYILKNNLFAKILNKPSHPNKKIEKEKTKEEKENISLTYYESENNLLSLSNNSDINAIYAYYTTRPSKNVYNTTIQDSLIHISIAANSENTDTFSLFQGSIMIIPQIIFSKNFNMWVNLNSAFASDNISIINLSHKKPSNNPIIINVTVGKHTNTIPIVVDTNYIYHLNFTLKR